MQAWFELPKVLFFQELLSQLVFPSFRSKFVLFCAVLFLMVLFVPVSEDTAIPESPFPVAVFPFTSLPEATKNSKPFPCTLLLAVLSRKLLSLAPFMVNPCWSLPVEVFPWKMFLVEGQD